MKIIGITGSIGCGKTYLSDIIRSMGFAVYNPDDWVKYLYTKKSFLSIIKKEFPSVFNEANVFNKRALRNLVFGNNKELKKLEAIIHPLLHKKLKKLISKNSQKEDILFLDVAILYEMGWDKYCDFIIVADVDDDTQIKRVMKRDNITKEECKKIISVQSSKDFKKYIADYVIDTSLPYGINKVQLIKFIQEVI